MNAISFVCCLVISGVVAAKDYTLGMTLMVLVFIADQAIEAYIKANK